MKETGEPRMNADVFMIPMIDELRKHLRQHPADDAAWLSLAKALYYRVRDYAAAIEALAEVHRLQPGFDVRPLMGGARVRLGERDAGLKLILDSIEESPSTSSLLTLADAYLFLELYVEAESVSRKALEVAPESALAWHILGLSLRYLGRRRDAIAAFASAVELAPDMAHAWQEMGSQLIAEADGLREGIVALNKAVAISPDDPWSRVRLGIALWRAGEIGAARIQYKAAIEKAPSDEFFSTLYRDFEKAQDKGVDQRPRAQN